MAGDWMKIELELPDKPEVHYIAGALNLDPDAVVGKLIRVWQWFNKHTVDGNADGVTYLLLDRITYVTGFGESMLHIGWLEQNGTVLTMPKFDRHTSESAKKRAETNRRVAEHRKNKGSQPNNSGNKNVTQKALQKALPEKRREENINIAFDDFWNIYPNKKGRNDAEKKWPKLTDQEREKALSDCRVRYQSTEKQFIPHGSTYLNKKPWLDEPVNVVDRVAQDWI